MAKKSKALIFSMAIIILLIIMVPAVYGENSDQKKLPVGQHDNFIDQMGKLKSFKASLVNRVSTVPSPAPSPQGEGGESPRVYHVTTFGADPTGNEDSTEAITAAMRAACEGPTKGVLMEGISNLGGARVDLQGGHYLVSRPLRFPSAGVGNIMIHGGTIRASDNFPSDGYLIDLSSQPRPSSPSTKNQTSLSADQSQLSTSSSYNYEYVTLKDLMLDSNYRGGGISVINSLRTSIDNCYIIHFTSNGINVQQGHETYIRNSFLGQHVTAGADPGERSFSGTAITLAGNDNAVTDVVIFSAAVGVMVSGQANTLTGVHCYNKATGFGGTGIYLRLPGLTQTRIVNCYLDYTGIVAEDPVQLVISNSFFLGDAYVALKSVNGVVNGVNIMDNMFSGSGKGVEIVQLDESRGAFKRVRQVVVDRNSVDGMKIRSTVARGGLQGNGTTWTVDFNPVLLFPDLIRHVHYSFMVTSSTGPLPLFPNHVLRNSSENRVVIMSNVAVPATVFVTVDQWSD